ncbi:MAG: AmmeMemoRadiSam system protein A [Mycoplasmoidaceae bacterium]|nr:MAG: AmmeMemoRadiSam system protein A [Mycoplasmoidaceae bacterium]
MGKIVSCFYMPHPPLVIDGIGNIHDASLTRKSYLYFKNKTAMIDYDTTIIISPHAKNYKDIFYFENSLKAYGDFDEFAPSLKTYEYIYDTELSNKIYIEALKNQINCDMTNKHFVKLDHGSLVPLSFTRSKKILIIPTSGLSKKDHFLLGSIINNVIKKTNKKVLLICSGDLSHNSTSWFDLLMKESFEKLNFNKLLSLDERLLNEVQQCGYYPMVILLGIIDHYKITINSLSYENPFKVGYYCCEIILWSENIHNNFISILIDKPKSKYTIFAKQTVENYINNKTSNSYIPSSIQNGVFVTIKKLGKLRGCIGTILPTKNSIEEEIYVNSISACSLDNRFDRINSNELEYLEYDVDVLNPPTPVFNINELNPKKYGIIVRSGYKQGVLLPDLDGVDTPRKQINIAKQKANIQDGEELIISKFTITRHY